MFFMRYEIIIKMKTENRTFKVFLFLLNDINQIKHDPVASHLPAVKEHFTVNAVPAVVSGLEVNSNDMLPFLGGSFPFLLSLTPCQGVD